LAPSGAGRIRLANAANGVRNFVSSGSDTPVMTDFPADVEAHCRRLAVQHHWSPETEAAFRATVAWYRALDESSEPRRYFEHVDHEGLVDKGARWLWEAIVVNDETVAIRQIELG
jgi:hypothetical protein